jgi:lysozyme family protein
LSSNFISCLHEVLCLEGGYADDPRDPGGPTNFGITRAELADVRQVPIDSISPADMQALTLAEAASIYRKRYWNAMSCDDLAHGVDLMVFQFGVNAGIDASARILQHVTGASVDGIIGPITLAAANRIAPATLVQSLAAAQLVQYRGFAQWDVYGTGWTNRIDAATKAALAMAAG